MIGQTVSHYKILEELGGGGMGVVYKAEDLTLKRTVALKFLPPELTRDKDAKTRFIHEARAASALQHHNICAIHEVDETADGQLFICMDCYEGETLREKIAKGPASVPAAIDVVSQVAEGLSEAHTAGVVHRDVKPANVIVTDKGVAKILDFGLAKLSGMTKVTKTGTMVGTVAYMSPEQAGGEETDFRSDVWSLGAVLYEMVAGRLPFRGEVEPAMVYSILNEDPEPLTALRTGLPRELERITDKCLAKDPSERYQTTADLVADLRRLSRDISDQPSRSRLATESKRATKSRPRRLLGTSVAGVVVLIALLLSFNVGNLRDWITTASNPDDGGRIESLAILPFVNTGSDPDTDYLSDEIPASIINNLSRLSNLRVVPRSTVSRYKGQDQDLASVGRELNVGAILTGQIRVHGQEISIRAELVDIVNDRQLWGERYTQDLAEILSLEQKIAAEISDALRLQLTSADRDRLSTYRTESAEAHRLYLKGRYFWNKRSEAGLNNAIEYFQRSIEEDPTYALPYTGVADCYIVLAAFGFLSPREAFPRAKAAASRALEIEETLAEAHTSLAFALACYDWDWDKAESEYKRAIELNPSYATTFHWYAYLLLNMGRGDEAIAASERAVELDPLSFPVMSSSGLTYYVLRQYDKAEAICLKVLEMEPEFAMARSTLGMVYSQMGWSEKALDEWTLAAELSNGAPEDMAYLGFGYARFGREDEARTILEEFNDRANQVYVPPCYFAMIHAGFDEKDRVIDWLNRAYEAHDFYLSYHLIDPMFDQMRDHPRFVDLMRRVGIDPSHFAPTANE